MAKLLKNYRVTRKAGRYVGGQRSPGVGRTVMLSERQAAHDLRTGALIDIAAEAEKAEAAKAAEAAETADTEKSLDKMTKDELIAYAEANEIEVSGTKAEILEAIKAAEDKSED